MANTLNDDLIELCKSTATELDTLSSKYNINQSTLSKVYIALFDYVLHKVDEVDNKRDNTVVPFDRNR